MSPWLTGSPLPLNSPWANPWAWVGATATHPERRSGRPCPWAPPKKCSACTADWVPRRTNWGSGGGSGEAAILAGDAGSWGPRKGISDSPVVLQEGNRSLPGCCPAPSACLPSHLSASTPKWHHCGPNLHHLWGGAVAPHPSEVTLTPAPCIEPVSGLQGLLSTHPIPSDSLNPTGHSSGKSDSSSLRLSSLLLGCPHAWGCLSCL